MARMIGKIHGSMWGQCRSGCCDLSTSKTRVKREELTQALSEAEDEMYGFERDHENGICSDPRTGMGGCNYCYPEDFDYYDASELDGIKGVWTDTARLIY